ncbi:MAG TPA: hypothetical protein VE033_03100 [Acetobacteraceae bacterium]|nr:hypothetical protein [Acetobacteraceae bacterium]
MPIEHLKHVLRTRIWRVLLMAAVLTAAGSGAVLMLPRHYLAETVVAPAETTGIATSALLLGGSAQTLASLVGTRPMGNFAVYLGALRSPEAAAVLAAETSILADLTDWRRAGPAGMLRGALGLDRPADLDDVRAWLERRLTVTQSLGTVTWTLGLSHRDRDSALDALRRLHAHAEAKVRADLEDLARRRAAALEARLARENDSYLRQSLFELLAQQQRAGLVVAADEAVAARLVAPPSVELRPSLPNRPLLLGLILVAAPLGALGLLAAQVLLRAGAARA